MQIYRHTKKDPAGFAWLQRPPAALASIDNVKYDMKPLEEHMIEPIHDLVLGELGLHVVTEAFTAGYGIADLADLVGATSCSNGLQARSDHGLNEALDERLLLKVLLSIDCYRRTPIHGIPDISCATDRESRIKYSLPEPGRQPRPPMSLQY